MPKEVLAGHYEQKAGESIDRLEEAAVEINLELQGLVQDKRW